MEKKWFFKIALALLGVFLVSSCSKSILFVDEQTGFSIEIPSDFKRFNVRQKEKMGSHFVSKWGVLSIIIYPHQKIEADDEALSLFLQSRLYGDSKEGDKKYIDYHCYFHLKWVSLQAILIGGSEMAPVYTQTLILDNRETEVQVRLTASNLRQLRTASVKKMLKSAQFVKAK